jgi:Mg-chelatase subunit ChlD
MPVHTPLLWIVLICFVCGGPEAHAADAKSLHAMIVFDISGSMRQSDPARSSVAAAQLFTDLVRADDAVGLATFSGMATTLVPVTASADSKANLHMHLNRLRFNGATTNLVAALEVGLAAFPASPNADRKNMVLLLTDGQLDLGKERKGEEPAALEQITQSLIPEYRRRGIALYTIAFTGASDHVLLKKMADASGGEFRFIEDATKLHEAFGQMFIGGHQAESFPLDHNRMLIDSSIQDLSIVLEKSEPGERIALVTPGKETMRSGDAGAGAVWRSTPTYDVVNLRQPQRGEWVIERSGNTNKGVGIIAASTLSLQVELGSTFLEAGTRTKLRAFLLDKSVGGGTIWREAGQAVAAELSSPDGAKKALNFVPQRDGSFVATTPLLQITGKYSLTLTATTPTIKRQRTITFAVDPECLQASVSSSAPVIARLALAETCSSYKSLTIEAEYTSANGSMQRTTLSRSAERLYEASIPPLTGTETGRVFLHVSGERSGERFMLSKGPWPLLAVPSPAVPQPADKGQSPVVATVVNKLLVVNLLLALLAVIGYAAYRYGMWKAKVVYGRSLDLDSDNDSRAPPPR